MALSPVHQYGRPIPGQSWTDNPGAPWQNPPMFPQMQDALDFTWDKLTMPKATIMVKTMLESGIPAENIARQMLFQGFAQNSWTPDVAMLIAKPVLAQIVAVGEASGAKDYKIWGKDKQLSKFLAAAEMQKDRTASKTTVDVTNEQDGPEDITGEQDGPDGTNGQPPKGLLNQGQAPTEDITGEQDGSDGTNSPRGLLNR